MNSRSVYLYEFFLKKELDWDTLQSANGVYQTFSILSMPATSSQQAQAWFNTKLVIWWSGYKAKHHNFQKHLKHVYVRCWLHFFRVCLFFSLSSFSGRKTALFGTSDFHQCSNAKLFPIYQNCTFFLFWFASAKWISWKIYAKERTQKRRTIDARMHSTTTKTSSSNKWWWYIQNILVQQVEWFFLGKKYPKWNCNAVYYSHSFGRLCEGNNFYMQGNAQSYHVHLRFVQ